jgi:hypothetical protein
MDVDACEHEVAGWLDKAAIRAGSGLSPNSLDCRSIPTIHHPDSSNPRNFRISELARDFPALAPRRVDISSLGPAIQDRMRRLVAPCSTPGKVA